MNLFDLGIFVTFQGLVIDGVGISECERVGARFTSIRPQQGHSLTPDLFYNYICKNWWWSKANFHVILQSLPEFFLYYMIFFFFDFIACRSKH